MKFLNQPAGIVIHHSATRDTASISYRAIVKYHKGKMGWDDIGYHYLIEDVDNEAMLFTGRGLQYYGAHTRGCNDTIGICVVGNYDDVEVPSVLVERLIDLLESLLVLYPHLGKDDIHFHRETANKSCPGLMFFPLHSIKSLLSRRME